MDRNDFAVGNELLHNALLIDFTISEPIILPYGEEGEISLEVTLSLNAFEQDDPSEVIEWAAFALIYALAGLSFSDARPRGYSTHEYLEKDHFTVADMVSCLRLRQGGLRFEADYFRGRCMKTHINVKTEGRVTLQTRQRGTSALRWLDTLQGKKRLTPV